MNAGAPSQDTMPGKSLRSLIFAHDFSSAGHLALGSLLWAPTQMVTGSAETISGGVIDPDGELVDAIHVYRDANGNGELDLGIDQLLDVDTTPRDGYAFNAGSLPSGTHVLHVATMKNGTVADSSTTTVAARWWTVSISTRNRGETAFPTTGDLKADHTPIELTPGPASVSWKEAVSRRVTGMVRTYNPIIQKWYDSTFTPPGGAFVIGTQRELSTAFGRYDSLDMPSDTKLIVLKDLFSSTNPVNDKDHDDR